MKIKMVIMLLISHLALILFSLFFYIILGLDQDEFLITISIFIPVFALTASIFSTQIMEIYFRDFVSNKVPDFYSRLIYGHFFISLAFITIKATGGIIYFKDMAIFTGIIEFFLCASIGGVLFSAKE